MARNHFTLPKYSHLIKRPRRLSIDCGTILTKLINIENTTEKDIKYHVFLTSKLEKNLEGLDEALKDAEEIYITGQRRYLAKAVLTLLVTATVLLVDEEEAFAKGFKILYENVDESEVLYNVETQLDEGEICAFDENNPFIKKILRRKKANVEDLTIVEDHKIKTPSILMWSGATITFYLLKEGGDIDLVGKSNFAGETYRGLSNCIVECNDYERITFLANSGRRANIDTQLKEVFSDHPNSPYGHFPPELPILSFGKFGDHMINKEDMRIEDLMASFSYLIYNDNLFHATQLCQAYQAKTIYVGGALFMAPVFEKFNKLREKMNFGFLKTTTLDCNYVSTLGALLIND